MGRESQVCRQDKFILQRITNKTFFLTFLLHNLYIHGIWPIKFLFESTFYLKQFFSFSFSSKNVVACIKAEAVTLKVIHFRSSIYPKRPAQFSISKDIHNLFTRGSLLEPKKLSHHWFRFTSYALEFYTTLLAASLVTTKLFNVTAAASVPHLVESVDTQAMNELSPKAQLWNLWSQVDFVLLHNMSVNSSCGLSLVDHLETDIIQM